MLKWRPRVSRGRRASDLPPPCAASRRDPALEAAIEDGCVDVAFQPQIEPATGDIVGVEALARWDGASDNRSLFERAEASGLAERLSRLVQQKALRAAATWQGALRTLDLSLNLRPQEIATAGYENWLLDEVASTGIAPERVTLEITENSLIEDCKAVAERLSRLRQAGMRIAVDDFGTGYASLAYLTSLPLDALKIDRELILDIVGGTRDRIVVKAMIQLARELQLKVIVEGVESTAQLALLAEWGCDLYQGFLGAGALTEAELKRFVSATQVEAA